MKKAALIVVAVVLVFTISRLANRHAPSGTPSSETSTVSARGGSVHSLAPAFTLDDLNGQPLSLANYHGKVVLLDFWATWCAPCRTEIPHFVDMQNRLGDQGVQVIGVSMDDGPKPVRDFYAEYKMNYPVGLGTDKVAESYGGVLGLPVLFLIGRDGRIAAKYVGEADMAVVEQQVKSLLQAQ